MSFVTQNLRQTATYWTKATPDGYGGTTFSSPTSVKCRWIDKTDVSRDFSGQEFVSSATVYVDADVAVGGYLYLGTSASTTPNTLSGAYEIRNFKKIPTLRADNFSRKALL